MYCTQFLTYTDLVENVNIEDTNKESVDTIFIKIENGDIVAFAARIWLFGQYLKEITVRYPGSRFVKKGSIPVKIPITPIPPTLLIWKWKLTV